MTTLLVHDENGRTLTINVSHGGENFTLPHWKEFQELLNIQKRDQIDLHFNDVSF